MLLRKHGPVPESAMTSISPRNSICETLRQAYHMAGNDDVRLKLREATAMAKAMSARLEEDKKNWFFNAWDPNPEFLSKIDQRKRKPIDVLLIAYDDFANTGYRFWMCAKRLGLNALMVKGVHHPFGYPNQAPIHPSLSNTPISSAPITVMAPGLEHLIESSHVIHLIASTYPLLCSVKWHSHPVVVQHGGSVYRQNPDACNAIFNQFAHQTIIQCPDLMGLGAKNEELIYYPVDTTVIRPDFEKKGDELVIGHFPSNPAVKGTERIYDAITELVADGCRIKYIGARPGEESGLKPWQENLKRFKQCDVIIETCMPDQNGKSYGEFGNTALEAAASGCVIVSNCLHRDIYDIEYGDLGIHVANNPGELKKEIKRLSLLDDDNLYLEKKRCYQWIEDCHTIDVTAERLWNLVYSRYF